MQITREDRVRMERAHVHAWPALRTTRIDGWLWRSSGGGSQRANSVSTIDFSGADPHAAIDRVEAAYRAAGTRARFQTFDDTSPPDLTDLLCSRGYQESETTITMFRPVETACFVADVELRDDPWTEWLDVYTAEITENRRDINRLILQQVPSPRAFFGCRTDNGIIATALCVSAHRCAVIECVATRADRRRRGAAQTVLQSISNWASTQNVDLLGLQVVATNTAALTLYQRHGFVAGAANRFWVLPAA